MRYCVYNLKTGVIRARFDTPESDAAMQLQQDEGIYIGDADPRRHSIVSRDGQLEVIEREEDEVARSDYVAKLRMQILDTRTVEIDGEQINCMRSLLDYITASPGSDEEAEALRRLKKIQARKDEIRSQISGGKGTSERAGRQS